MGCAATLMVLAASTAMATGADAQVHDPLTPESALMAPLATRSLLLDIAAAGDRLVAVGERGHILLSDDNGVSWRQVASPVSVALTGVTFVDDLHGWAVGHDGAILRSADGGLSWELVRWAPEDESPLLDVWFSDADNGFAIGAYGTFLATSDGGTSWEQRWSSDADYHLQHLARGPDGRLFIAAEAGAIYRSDDGGGGWSELPSPYEGSLFGTLPLGDGVVLLFGLRGHAFRSQDDGDTWEPVAIGTQAMLTAATETAGGQVVMVGLVGSFLVSADGGRTFELRSLPDRLGISALVRARDGALVLVGEGGAKRLAPDGSPVAGSERGER